MSIKGKAYIAGIYEHPTRLAKDTRWRSSTTQCARGAGGRGPHEGRRRRLLLRRRRAGPRADVDGRVHGTEGAACRFDRYRRFFLCAHVGHAAEAIARASAKVALITLAGRPRARAGDRHRAAHARPPTPDDPFEIPYGRTARNVRQVRHASHVRIRHDHRAARLDQGRGLAPRAVQPAAMLRNVVTVEEIVNSPMVAGPFASPRLLRDLRWWRRADGAPEPEIAKRPEAPAGESDRRRRGPEGGGSAARSISLPPGPPGLARRRSPKPGVKPSHIKYASIYDSSPLRC